MFCGLIYFSLLAIFQRLRAVIEQTEVGRHGLFPRSPRTSLHSALTPVAELNNSSDIKKYNRKGNSTNVVLAGMIRDAADMSWDSFNFVTRLSCLYDVDIHIITGSDKDQMSDWYRALSDKRYGGRVCSTVHIVAEPDIKMSSEGDGTVKNIKALLQPDIEESVEGVGRVGRIKALRDFQRADIAAMLDGEDLEEYTVIVADLDLLQLPAAEKVVDEATKMRHKGHPDVLCSAGVERGTGGYYDTFATVLLPDTWVYPVQDRKREQLRQEEDQSMILGGISDLTPVGLLNWFQAEGKAADQFTVPVRSCFGGLALYRAEKWLEPGCHYSRNSPIVNSRYANKEDQEACEHVVFHQCLRDADSALSVAVLPDMQTLWNSGRVEPVDKVSTTAEKDQRHLLDSADALGNQTSSTNRTLPIGPFNRWDSNSHDTSQPDHHRFRCGKPSVFWFVGIPVVTGAFVGILL